MEAFKWAYKTSYLKTINTIDSWKKRNNCERFINIFTGDLAKNIIKEFIINNISSISNEIIEYDKIRIDNFKNEDSYDLIINDCTIEIKSSCEKFTKDLQAIYKERNIMINIGNIHEHNTCIVVQVFFIPNNLKYFKNYEKVDECDDFSQFASNFLDSFVKQDIKAIIAGWADYNMQKKAKESSFSVENYKIGSSKREYAKLLISESKSPDELLSFINNDLI